MHNIVQPPILNIITIGIDTSEILSTLSTLTHSHFDARVRIIVVVPKVSSQLRQLLPQCTFVEDDKSGVYTAMNRGLSRCSGGYIWFLNSGDICLLSKNNFDELLTFLSNLLNQSSSIPPVIFCSPFFQRFSALISRLPTIVSLYLYMLIMPVPHQNILVPQTIHFPFNTSYKYGSDFDLLCSIFWGQKGSKLCAFSQPISQLTAGGISDIHRASVLRERYSIVSNRLPFVARILPSISLVIRLLREFMVLNYKKIFRRLPFS